ncbi:uncharacterized protein [Antedon mediterranea]|uniref:uncharacterized protein n=1 Tax=Antedon mediterranea TaxID=105859 RepID=UPI003AF9AA71
MSVRLDDPEIKVEKDEIPMDEDLYVNHNAVAIMGFDESTSTENMNEVDYKDRDTLEISSGDQILCTSVTYTEDEKDFGNSAKYHCSDEVLENRRLIKAIQKQQKEMLKRQEKMQSTLDAILMAVNNTSSVTSVPIAHLPNCQGHFFSDHTKSNQAGAYKSATTSSMLVTTSDKSNYQVVNDPSGATPSIQISASNHNRGKIPLSFDLTPVVIHADEEGFIELGSKDIKPPLLFSFDLYTRLLRSNRKPTLLTKALMGELFTKEEMAVSNMGGKKGKKALDSRKITAIFMQMDIQFSAAGIQLNAKEIKNAINDKCRYVGRTMPLSIGSVVINE